MRLNECASRDPEPSGKQGSKRQDTNHIGALAQPEVEKEKNKEAPSNKRQASSLTTEEYKILWDRYNVKKRSQRNNRRPKLAVQDAWTVVQPASYRMHYRRQACECKGLHVQRVLCIKIPLQF